MTLDCYPHQLSHYNFKDFQKQLELLQFGILFWKVFLKNISELSITQIWTQTLSVLNKTLSLENINMCSTCRRFLTCLIHLFIHSASVSTFIATPGTVLGPGELEITRSSSKWRQHNSAARREMYHFLNTLRHSLNSFFLRAMAVMTLKNLTEGGPLSSRCLLVPLFLLLSLGDHLLF